MDFNKCSDITKNKRIVVSENKREFILINENRKTVTKIEVDGCLISDHRPRCDYLFEINNPCTLAIYVELKGKKIDKAYKQLEATLGYLSKRHNKSKKQCYIVVSRVPKSGTNIQVYKAKMAKNKVQLFVKTSKAEIKI